MKNHNKNRSELLVEYAISKSMALGLLISLTILWDQAEWPTEGLEEFIDRYWEWIDAYNKNDEAVRELVRAMHEATGIEVRI